MQDVQNFKENQNIAEPHKPGGKLKALEQKVKNWPWLKPLMRYGSAALALAIVVAMLIVLWQTREDLLEVLKRVEWGWLLAALGVNLLSTLGYCAIWYYVGRSLSSQATYRATLSVVSISSAGRYLPGGIWAGLGLLGLSSRVGLSILAMPVLFGLAQGVHLLLAWCISVNGLAWLGVTQDDWWRSNLVMVFSVGLVTAAVLSYRRYFQPLIKRLPDFGPKIRLSRHAFGKAILSSLGVWLLCGVRLSLILLGCQANLMPGHPFQLILFLTWVAAISGIALAIFFFIPLGLGAVELSMATFLGLITSDWPLIVAVLLLNRVIQIANDLIVVAYSIYHLKKTSVS